MKNIKLKIISILLLFLTINIIGQVTMPSIDSGNRLVFNNDAHIKEFIEYYDAEYTDSEIQNVMVSLESQGFESLLNINKRIEYYTNGQIELPEDNDIEDDLYIGDDRFATLLNKDHELIISSNIYKYEPEGVYFTDLKNEKNLQNYITDKKKKNNFKHNLDNYSTKKVNNDVVYRLDNGILFYPFNYINTVKYQYNGENRASNSITNPYNLDSCQFDDDGFFEGLLPGGSEVCKDYINNSKRIRVKFSNQNFIVYSSVYAKVKSQKKHSFWGYWYKSDYCEFLELGLSKVFIKFPVTLPTLPSQTNNFVVHNFENDQYYNANGTFSDPYAVNIFDSWPFENGQLLDFELFWNIQIEVGDSELNSLVEDAIVGLINTLGTSFDQLFETPEGTNVGITINTLNGVYFGTYGERKRRYGVKKVSKTWDNNSAIIGYRSDLADVFGDGNFLFNPAKTYDVSELDIYGVGRYQNVMYGRRIFMEKESDKNTTLLDSDNDKIADIYDQCRYQYGIDKHEGCSYSLLSNSELFTHGSLYENNGNVGACFNLELKSSDYPSVNKTIQPLTGDSLNIKSSQLITISGETGLSIKPNNGSVTLSINQNLCQITGPLRNFIPSNENSTKNSVVKFINESEKRLVVFPNPTTSGVFSLSLNNNNLKGFEVQINDLSNGTVIFKNKIKKISLSEQIDISNYPNGIYLIKLISGDKVYSSKIIKKN